VTLVVYDVMGRTVARLVDRTLAPGRHRATLDASTLPSGVYFYRFRAGEAFAETHRMVVVR